jgi:hypothetical protein
MFFGSNNTIGNMPTDATCSIRNSDVLPPFLAIHQKK